jgi:hypothetical protein
MTGTCSQRGDGLLAPEPRLEQEEGQRRAVAPGQQLTVEDAVPRRPAAAATTSG